MAALQVYRYHDDLQSGQLAPHKEAFIQENLQDALLAQATCLALQQLPTRHPVLPARRGKKAGDGALVIVSAVVNSEEEIFRGLAKRLVAELVPQHWPNTWSLTNPKGAPTAHRQPRRPQIRRISSSGLTRLLRLGADLLTVLNDEPVALAAALSDVRMASEGAIANLGRRSSASFEHGFGQAESELVRVPPESTAPVGVLDHDAAEIATELVAELMPRFRSSRG